jgi:hypothetical protein
VDSLGTRPAWKPPLRIRAERVAALAPHRNVRHKLCTQNSAPVRRDAARRKQPLAGRGSCGTTRNPRTSRRPALARTRCTQRGECCAADAKQPGKQLIADAEYQHREEPDAVM